MTNFVIKPEVEELLAKWQKARTTLAEVKSLEMKLRVEIAGLFFPAPKEGTNNLQLSEIETIVLDYKLNRTVDQQVVKALWSTFVEKGVPVEQVFKYSIELATGVYKKLEPEKRKLVDQCITMKPGSPGLEIKVKA